MTRPTTTHAGFELGLPRIYATPGPEPAEDTHEQPLTSPGGVT